MDEPLISERDSARQRALRIPLAYHRTCGPLWAWRLVFTLACFLAGGAYLAWVLAGGTPAAMQLSPGTLAKDHARWDSDCRACHVPFVPQRPDASGTRALSLSWMNGTTKGSPHPADAKCSDCHQSAGVHQANQIATEVESCASCHRDHQGRDFEMARMDDAHCTRCHDSIAEHRKAPGAAGVPPIVNVMSFQPSSSEVDAGHPTFRSLQLQEDPGNIRFSHRLHMTRGQLYPGQIASPGKELVQLACDSCHQPETATGNGAYMRPIKYEQHCRSCHPLNMPGQPEALVPHGLKSKQLGEVVKRLLAEKAKKPQKNIPSKRLIPGKTPSNSRVDYPRPARDLIASHGLAELRQNKCSQCHDWQEENSAEVMPAKIPDVWLRSAHFNHQKHQSAAKCQDCHVQAAATLPAGGIPGKLADDDEVMIPNIDNCARCHAPRNQSTATGGARFDCAECHRYHSMPPQVKPLGSDGLSRLQRAENIPFSEALFVKLVADTHAKSLPPKKHSFVGTQSCSATGCHGAVKGNGPDVSYTRFTSEDPHTRAFLLLDTQPSLDIYRRLTNQPQAKLEDQAYFAFLLKKCVGCHATPPAHTSGPTQPESYAAGVSCESCHGPAASWQHTHFNKQAKQSAEMLNLADLSVRATACAECHIGPQVSGEQTYDVNHDLIASGHPRLTFEFEAQLANLPAHWNAAKNVKSHFEAWRTGELATATQQEKLHASRDEHEFASFRCFDCHHGLTANPTSGRLSFPPRTGISQNVRTRLAELSPSPEAQATMLLELLKLAEGQQAAGSPGIGWEEHVQFSLALAAYCADNPQNAALAKDTETLQQILSKSFRTLPRDKQLTSEPFFIGGPYDSPTGYDAHEERLKQVRENIQTSLTPP